MIKSTLDQDLKNALLSKDTFKTTLLRSLKSAILYAEVAAQKRDEGLSDDEIVAVFQKEAKKRQESADAFLTAGDQTRADHELAEKQVIDTYLPAQLSEAELTIIVDEQIAALNAQTMQDMGKVIGAVKQKTGATADGGMIARLVKERLA